MGVRAIPHVYWGLRDDLDRWADWLEDNPCVSTIAIDLQTADSDQDWKSATREITYLTSLLPRDIQILFSGVCHIDRVVHLRDIWPNLSVCNYGPQFLVHHRFQRRFGLQSPLVVNNKWFSEEILESAVLQYERVLEQEHSRAGLLAILRSDLVAVDGQEELGSQFPWPEDQMSGDYLQLGFSDVAREREPVTVRSVP